MVRERRRVDVGVALLCKVDAGRIRRHSSRLPAAYGERLFVRHHAVGVAAMMADKPRIDLHGGTYGSRYLAGSTSACLDSDTQACGAGVVYIPWA
jgi:hypothetical protein